MRIPTAEEEGAIRPVNDEPIRLEKCLVCDEPNPSFEWNDMHGEGSCFRCGTPYMIFRHDEAGLRLGGAPTSVYDESLLPILREYFLATGQHSGLGTFLGSPRYPDRRRTHFEWARRVHPEMFTP